MAAPLGGTTPAPLAPLRALYVVVGASGVSVLDGQSFADAGFAHRPPRSTGLCSAAHALLTEIKFAFLW